MEAQGVNSISNTSNLANNNQPANESNHPPTIDYVNQVDETQDDLNEVDEIPGNKRTRSVAWNHFTKKKVKGVIKAECHYCHIFLSGNSKNGTKHLLDHYDCCKKRPYKDIRQHILVQEQKKADGSPSYVSNYTFNADTSRKNLAEMIIVHEYPLSMVEHRGFRKFVGGLQPLFKVPSRNTIKSEILKIYEYEKQKTLKLLGKNTSRVEITAITTDMWTASHQRKGFMAVTAHVIDQNWNMQSRIMRFIYVPCPHTAEVLVDVLYDCQCDWNLDRKLSTITVDNCNTNESIIDKLLEKLPLSSLMMNEKLLHMRCCAHILNLIVQDGLSVIGDGIEKIRGNVAFWTASPKRQQKFEEAARQLEIPSTKKLALDCKTQWNSTFLMLSTAVVYKDVFNRLKQREKLYDCLPSQMDWDIAEEICERWQLFYELTLKFSGSLYPTVNVFSPSICEIGYSLREWVKSSVLVIREMALQMLIKFDKYWSVIHGVMGMAAVLDPRYKLISVELLLPTLYGPEKAAIEIKNLKKFVGNLFKEYLSSAPRTRNEFQGIGSCSLSSESSSGHHVGFKKLLSNIASIATEHDDSDGLSKLESYLKEKRLPMDLEIDLLLWWKTNGFKYPTLQRIAKDILVIPISNVASESALSTGGRLITPHRSRLHQETLEALMCAQSWLLNEIRETCSCSDETEAYCRSIDYDYVDEESENKLRKIRFDLVGIWRKENA